MCISLEAQFAFPATAAAIATDAAVSTEMLAFAFTQNCMDETGQRCININNTNITLQM